jgi:hypothetical protein
MPSPATEEDHVDEFEEFADALLSAAPAVADELRRDEEDLRPDMDFPTMWFGTAGTAIADAFDRLSDAELRTVFGLVERHLASGSDLMGDCLTTGLLEAVANAVSRGKVDGGVLAGLLGPQSRRYVDAWDQFTLGRSSLESP